MGCFLGCFGGRNNRRRQKLKELDQAETNKLSVESVKPVYRNDRVHMVEEITKSSVIPITEICEESEEKCSPSSRKRVTFDSEVKTYEHIVLQEYVELLEEEKGKVKPEERSVNSSKTDQSSSENSEVVSNSSGTYPSGHRYKDCRESDDELECSESDLEEDEGYYSDDGFDEDKLHNLTKEVSEEIGDNTEEINAKLRRSNEIVRDGNQYVHGVLNPVENLTQWKSVKFIGKTMQKQSQKENSNLISDQEEKKDSSSFSIDSAVNDTTLSFKPKSKTEHKKPKNEELTVDASLSTWLSTSETGSECDSVSITPEKSKSSCYSKRVISCYDDRPILCALTMEDIKQFSTTSTPRKSPSKSPDETPIIGTVGGYWSNRSETIDFASASSFKGIPNTTSKYREDKSVNWHSTPFEARLEKALKNRDE